MSSLQQAPVKGQQVPPPVLIDGVSEQQIDAAVKAHVKEKRAVKLVHPQASVVLARIICKMLADKARNIAESETSDDKVDDDAEALDAFDCAANLLQRETRELTAITYKNRDALGARLFDLQGVAYCMMRSLGNDSHAARMLKSFVGSIDVLMEALEYAEDGRLMTERVTA